jgi:hypothetical protein
MKSTIGSWFSFSVCPVTTEGKKRKSKKKLDTKKLEGK